MQAQPRNPIVRALSWVPLAAAITASCTAVDPGPHFVSPYDGQTDWPADAPLQVRVGTEVAPEGHTIDPALITVVDLDVGGRVEGAIVVEQGDLWFFPDAPFAAGHRFAWSIAPPHEEARSIHLGLPTELIGSAVFSTASVAEPIAALRLGDDVCLVWSRGPGATDELPLASGVFVFADGIRVDVGAATPTGLSGIEPLTPGDAALGCLDLDGAGIDAPTVEGVRVEGTEEVWQLRVMDRAVDDLLAEHHRLGGSTSEEGS